MEINNPTEFLNFLYKIDLSYGTDGAMLSKDRIYRYALWRIWNKARSPINFIGLNPSTADEKIDDPTIRRCIGFAKRWEYGGLIMTNLFAYRSTNPAKMKEQGNNAIGNKNNEWIRAVAEQSGLSIAAWGSHGTFLNRQAHVLNFLKDLPIFCFKVTANGCPCHPLYMPYNHTIKTFNGVKIT